ncbi:hypothetical protein BGZ59_010145, partial [Podila verticillata]
MEHIPSHNTVPDALAVDISMRDELACGKIEDIVLSALNKIRAYMASADAERGQADEDNQGLDSVETAEQNQGEGYNDNQDHQVKMKSDVDFESLKARITDELNGVVLSRVRGTLYDDSHILCTAKHYKIDPHSRFIKLDEDVAEFYLLPDRFEAWRMEHQRSISTNFVQKRIYKYNDVDNQYRLTFACQCAGKKQEPKDGVRGGVSGKPRMRKQGMKSGCQSMFSALFQPLILADGSKVPVCLVVYHYQHNHSVGDITDLGTRQKSTAIKSTIERLILQGSTIQRVMQQLTMDYDKFAQITRGNGQQLSRDDFITYEDVYNIWHKIATRAMRKDQDPVLSAMKWMEEFSRNKAFTFYDSEDKSFGQYYGHKTNLFTLVLKNADTGFGIPVAFLLTKTCDAFILSRWLHALRDKMKDLFSTADKDYDYMPEAVVTDQGSTEILAIRSVFPDVPILYCAWHVLKVWEREVKIRMTGLGDAPMMCGSAPVMCGGAPILSGSAPVMCGSAPILSGSVLMMHRSTVRSDLRKILYERSKPIAMDLIKSFRETWSSQEELLQYLDKNYFGPSMFQEHEWQVVDVQKHWMLCYRQDISYASIDTNNYIESWHNTLKRHFFKDKQQRRPDTVIYILAILAVPHFQQKCMRSIVNVGKMNPAKVEQLKLKLVATEHVKTRKSRGYVGAYISQVSDLTLRVESFTDPTVAYDVEIDFTRTPTGHIIRCSCKYFYMHRSC